MFFDVIAKGVFGLALIGPRFVKQVKEGGVPLTPIALGLLAFGTQSVDGLDGVGEIHSQPQALGAFHFHKGDNTAISGPGIWLVDPFYSGAPLVIGSNGWLYTASGNGTGDVYDIRKRQKAC